MEHIFSDFVRRYLNKTFNQAALAEAAGLDPVYLSRMINHAKYTLLGATVAPSMWWHVVVAA